jgi:hypothetical protein
MTWIRCCTWITDNIDRFQVNAIPEIVSVFEVWQNGWADFPNRTSERILATVMEWLEDIEDRFRPEEFRYYDGPWSTLRRGTLEELEDRLRALLLRSVRWNTQTVETYLSRLRARRRLRKHAFKQVLTFSRILSEKCASNLVDLSLAQLKKDLPADVAARPTRAGRSRSFSYHDWTHLAIHHDTQDFFPPSPLREPFASLLQTAPADGLRLVRELTNHAITAWRQLFKLDWERRATPIPLVLNLPWGEQAFWGDARVYCWFRGHGAPHSVEAGLMALEHWAFEQLERGRDVDEVIRDVVSSHESVAVLGIAVAIALSARRCSRTILPLVIAQRLWHWDLSRYVNDSLSQANLIGFTSSGDRRHADAVRDSNAREVRRLEIRSLAQLFVLSSDDDLRVTAQKAIQAFPKNLPFDFEEECSEKRTAWLKRTAEIWAELGREENYTAVRTGDGKGVYVQLNNTRANDPDVIAITERSAVISEFAKVLNWVLDSFEHQCLSDKLPLLEALAIAKRLDHPSLFERPFETAEYFENPASVVSGVASVALCFVEKLERHDLTWARDVILRAASTPEARDEFWFSRSVVLNPPCLSAVHGLAALVRRGVALSVTKPALIRLAGHPLEKVSETAIGGTMALYNQDPEFAWTAFRLGLKLSTADGARTSTHAFDPTSERADVSQAVREAIDELDRSKGLPLTSLPQIPAAWVYAPPSPSEDPVLHRGKSTGPVWRDPDVLLRWDFLPKVLAHVPIKLVMSDTLRRPKLLKVCDELVAWTIERLEPPWQQTDDVNHCDDLSTELFEWRSDLYQFLAHVALHMDQGQARRRFLEPVFMLGDELATSLIRPFVDTLVCSVMDAPAIPAQAPVLIETCLERVLHDKHWSSARESDGKVYGFDIPDLIKVFLFGKVEYAGGAARFANGDWSDVEHILPIVDPFVRAVGDLPSVASAFLTLCERAIDHYPPDRFVEEIAAVLAKQPGIPAGWRGSDIPGRIAALIQGFAQKTQPLPRPLAQAMLRILDQLIDMGDRRSAALQTSEVFRNIAIAPVPGVDRFGRR